MDTLSPGAAQTSPFFGTGSVDATLSEEQVKTLVADALDAYDLTGRKVLVLIPDGTRTAPVPLFFRLFHELLAHKVSRLDFMVALGTHRPMSDEALNRLVGISSEEKNGLYRNTHIYNHLWDNPQELTQVGVIPAAQAAGLTGGMLAEDVPVQVNRRALDYDTILVCGPVFPHEVVGFSGGSKYISPGIAGAEIINFTHWLGALLTCYAIIGVKHTQVREVIDQVAGLVPTGKLCFCSVVRPDGLYGLYIGDLQTAWSAAADLSARLHVRYMPEPFKQVLSVIPEMYEDLWTGAKGMYKIEPVVAEGGEVILYAPHITEISYTHGKIIDEIGYHVLEYFTRQWDRFKEYPKGVLAHSTHVKGIGAYAAGVETPRVRVTLATGIPEERCKQVNLGYRDPSSVHPEDFANREDQGILLVPHAGETLFRLKK